MYYMNAQQETLYQEFVDAYHEFKAALKDYDKAIDEAKMDKLRQTLTS